MMYWVRLTCVERGVKISVQIQNETVDLFMLSEFNGPMFLLSLSITFVQFAGKIVIFHVVMMSKKISPWIYMGH